MTAASTEALVTLTSHLTLTTSRHYARRVMNLKMIMNARPWQQTNISTLEIMETNMETTMARL